MLLIEALSETMKSCSEELTINDAVIDALTKAGLATNPTDQQILYVIKRLKELEEGEDVKEGSIPSEPESKNSFGQVALEWMAELSSEDLCLYLADYDYVEAKKIYCTMDKEEVIHTSSQKMKYEWEMMRVKFEASLFGSGGGYEAGPKEGETVIDLTKGDTAGLDQFFGRSH